MKQSPAKVAAATMQMKLVSLGIKKPVPERAVLHNSLRSSYREWQKAFINCKEQPPLRALAEIKNDEVTADSPADVRHAYAQFRRLANASLKLRIIAGVN